MDKHLNELIKWPDDDLHELLSCEPSDGIYKKFQSPSLLFFSREEIEAYNMAFHVDNEVCRHIIETVQDRVRQLQHIHRFRANQKLQNEQIAILDSNEVAEEVACNPFQEKINALQQKQQKHKKQSQQQTLFKQIIKENADLIDDESDKDDSNSVQKAKTKLLPDRYTNRDFFLCDMLDYAIKDDGASMEAPIFSLSNKKDISEWHWESKDGNRSVTITPSMTGRATQFDKDVLIYVVSHMTEAINRGRQDAKNRTVRFVVYDYLISTNKGTGGVEYDRLHNAFGRLRGTTIKTNIRTGGQTVREGFGLIERWKIIEKSPNNARMVAVEVTLSEWLFNAVQSHEVLTIHRDYFRLRKPLERRLYEIARKHCGQQTMWAIGLELLKEKSGARSHIRAFRSQIIDIATSDTLPEYRMSFNREKDQITFYTRDIKKLANNIAARQ